MGPLPPASASRPTGTPDPGVPVAGHSTCVRGPCLNHASLRNITRPKAQGTKAPRPVSAAVERAPSVMRWRVRQGPCGGLCCSSAQASSPACLDGETVKDQQACALPPSLTSIICAAFLPRACFWCTPSAAQQCHLPNMHVLLCLGMWHSHHTFHQSTCDCTTAQPLLVGTA